MVTTNAAPEADTKRAKNATLIVFTSNGFAFASWMARVPDVKASLHLTPGRLSLLLLAISAGSILGLPVAGRIVNRVGPAAAVRLGAGVALPGIAFAALMVQLRLSLGLVALGLFMLGLGVGVWDVAQNLEGTIVERGLTRAVMPWFHAGFSLGTVAGALVGAAMTYLRVPIALHVGTCAALALAALTAQTWSFLPMLHHQQPHVADPQPQSHSSAQAWLESRTLLLGVLVLAAAFAEGSANDWMAVAFVDGHHVSRSLGVIALALFLSFMTLGRILGTHLLDRFGRVPVLRVLFTAAIVGSGLVIFGITSLAFVGSAIWGLGASLGFPVGMSAAADDPRHAAARLSVVSTIGYLAFLGGPPLLGFLGDHFGILHALTVVAAVAVLAMLVSPVATPQ